MMFFVMSRREIQTYKTNILHVVISIKDPEEEKVILPKFNNRIDTLYLDFHDLDKLPKTEIEKEIVGYKLITTEDARRILNFFELYKDVVKLIICQCGAGISRSAGVAGALTVIAGQDDAKYFKEYIPNRRVYRTILEEANK